MSSEMKQAFQMLSVLKMVIPLKDLLMKLPQPEQSYADPQPKEIEVDGKKLFVVISKLAFSNKDDADNLIEFYNTLDKVLRKIAK